MENRGNLYLKSSKSGGLEVRNRGRRGYGKAFDASCPNSSEKNAEKFAVLYSQNSVVVNPNKCDFSFETTSNGGRGGQAYRGKTDAHGAKGLLKQLQLKRVAEKLADQNDREVGAGRCKDSSQSKEDDKSVSDISFKPTSNGSCGGQKDLQEEKVAEKLALRCPKSPEKFAVKKFQNSLEKAKLCETASKTISSGGLGEVNLEVNLMEWFADQSNNEISRKSSEKSDKFSCSKSGGNRNASQSDQISRPAVDLISAAHSSKLNLSKKFDEYQCKLQVENFNDTDEEKEKAERAKRDKLLVTTIILLKPADRAV